MTGYAWSFDWRADVTPYEDRLRVEQMLATARLFLACVASVAIYLDPYEPGVFVEVTYTLLGAYALFALGVLVLLRARPAQTVAARGLTHAIDIASAGAITALTQGTSSPFFVFFIFVVFAAALRWGKQLTLATGAGVAAWYLAEALLHARLAEEFEIVRFLMRTAYLLVATLVLAQLAGIQRAFYTDNYLLSRMLARVQRGQRFTESLEDVLEGTRAYAGARKAVLALDDQTAERLYTWERASPDARARHVSLRELPLTDRDTFFFGTPAGVDLWHVRKGRDRSLRVRGWATAGAVLRDDVEPHPHLALLERYGATSYLAVSAPLPQWDIRLLLFEPTRTGDGDLRFLQRLASYVGPVLHSQYLVSRLRTRIGEVERARMSRELHDGLIQSLIGLEMEVQALRANRAHAGHDVDEALDTLQQHLRRAVLDARDLMAELRPPSDAREGLLADVSSVVQRFRNDTGIDARLSADVDEVDCPPRTCAEVSRIVREALVNARKHSGAKHVVVHFGRADDNWTLSIDDDGRGFGFAGRRSQAELDAARQGPIVIKERVRAIGGELTVQSDPGCGARLEISWPVRRRGIPHASSVVDEGEIRGGERQ